MPPEDVQKYILATSDFSKGIQNEINHYVTKDRINDASYRQKLDPISKNIFRRQNPLELVLEDVSTFDAENPIIGSLVRELDLKKKGTNSDFIKSLPSQPGKEFEIKKRLDRLREIRNSTSSNNNNKNNNNNNRNNGGNNLFLPPPGTLFITPLAPPSRPDHPFGLPPAPLFNLLEDLTYHCHLHFLQTMLAIVIYLLKLQVLIDKIGGLLHHQVTYLALKQLQ